MMCEQQIHPIRILVVDDDPNVGLHLKRLLTLPTYDVCVVPFNSVDLVQTAIQYAAQFRPHVAIIELRLRDNYNRLDTSGFEVADHLQMTPWILYSAYLTSGIVSHAFEQYSRRNLVKTVNKASATHELVQAVDEAASRTSCSRVTTRTHHWSSVDIPNHIAATIIGRPQLPPCGSSEGTPELPPGLVDDLLYQLFPNSPDLALEIITNLPSTGQMGNPCDSVVLKITPNHKQPVVVKLATAERTQREARNFSQYVDGSLAAIFRAQLDNSKRFWDLGAAAYTFMESVVEAMPTFSAFYARHDPQHILYPLRQFFTTVWKPHYDAISVENNVCLYDLYEETLHLERKYEKLGVDRPVLTPLPTSLIDPLTWIRQHRRDSSRPNVNIAITHGDLHGDNLFVDHRNAWVIDYERSGPGHAVRDIAEIEVDIVTRLTAIEDFTVFNQLVQTVVATLGSAKPQASAPFPSGESFELAESAKTLAVIQGLHDIATGLGLLADSCEYLWALLIDALFIMLARATGPSQRKRAQWFGAALCAGLEAMQCPRLSWLSV